MQSVAYHPPGIPAKSLLGTHTQPCLDFFCIAGDWSPRRQPRNFLRLTALFLPYLCLTEISKHKDEKSRVGERMTPLVFFFDVYTRSRGSSADMVFDGKVYSDYHDAGKFNQQNLFKRASQGKKSMRCGLFFFTQEGIQCHPD